jgi:outer membrane receptor for ferrienterochelin and colicins
MNSFKSILLNEKMVAILIAIIFTPLTLSSQTVVTLKDAKTNEKIPFASAGISLLDGDSTITVNSNFRGQIILSEDFSATSERFVICVAGSGYTRLVDTLQFKSEITIKLAPKTYRLQEVVITSQIDSALVGNTVQKVEVISAEKIEAMGAVTLNDVLSNELNIRLDQDNILGAGMTMQGISGENVKILIDGVPIIGRLGGNIDLSQVNLENVEQIEVIQGPQSVSYGTNALAGTINIITKKEQKNVLDIGSTAYYQSIGQYNISARVGFKLNKHNFSFSGGRNHFDGWNIGDKSFITPELTSFSRTALWNPKTQYFGSFFYSIQLSKWYFKFKLDAFSEEIINRGVPLEPFHDEAFDDYYYTDRIDPAVFINRKFGKGKSVRFVAAYNYYRRKKNTLFTDLQTLKTQPSVPEDQDTSHFHSIMSRGIFAKTLDSNLLNYQVGYEFSNESANGKRIEDGTQVLGDYALFSSLEIRPVKSFVLSPALRLSYNTSYGAPILPSIAGRFTKSNFIFRASVARGFRAPSLKELYFEFNDSNHNIYGNDDLEAESSTNYTGSITWDVVGFDLPVKASLNLFYNDIDNIITLAQTEADSSRYEYINIQRYKTKGVNGDVSLSYPKLSVTVGGGLVYQYNLLSESEAVTEFSNYPEFKVNTVYKLKSIGLQLSLFCKYQGESKSFSIDGDNKVVQNSIGAYSITDLTISKFVWENKLKLMLGCKNLFDVTNVTANTSGGVHSSSASSVSVGTGRSYFMSLQLKISK